MAAFLAVNTAADESYVRARLVADTDELRAGGTFHLGVLLEPEPGWHVYWRNPGEAGLATEVLYDLPEGFEVGGLMWPVPIAFDQSEGIAGYGYEDSVVLASEIDVPDGVDTSIPANLSVSWLACKAVCVFGSAELSAEIPLKGDELATSRSEFKTWRGSLPTTTKSDGFGVTVTGGPVPDSGSVPLVVWLNWREAPGTVEFFPDSGPSLKVEGARSRTRGALTRIDFSISRLKTSSAPAETLRSLIVIEDDRGNRSARIVHIELD